MLKINKWLQISCQDTSLLVSQKMDSNLPVGKRLKVCLHLAMCGMCRAYEKQLMILRSLARKLGMEDALMEAPVKMSPETKVRLKQSIQSSN